jgi:hypothetical protein
MTPAIILSPVSTTPAIIIGDLLLTCVVVTGDKTVGRISVCIHLENEHFGKNHSINVYSTSTQ